MESNDGATWIVLDAEEDALLNEALCMGTADQAVVTTGESTLQIVGPRESSFANAVDGENDRTNNLESHRKQATSNFNEIEYERNVRNKPENAPVRKRHRENTLNQEDAKHFRTRCNSNSSSTTSSSEGNKRRVEYETCPKVLARRQKDVDYGKNTIGYDRYLQAVPKEKRRREHPKTPPKHLKSTRRGWDGMVRLWRKQLHHWDPPEEKATDD